MQNQNKWWKWGNPQNATHLNHFPKLRVFLEEKFNTTLSDDLPLPDIAPFMKPPRINETLIKKLFPFLKPAQISIDNSERLLYAFGKSYKDIIKSLTVKEFSTPDFILFPECIEDISRILKIAAENKIKIITFGGGSNVVGAFSSAEDLGPAVEYNAVCTLNMQRLNSLIDIDEFSHTATFETGIFGPHLEKILNEKGFTLGHFPQSFEYSTLGGWLALRSAGQESGLYGKIEDMVLWLKVVSPSGIVENIDFPKHACGTDIQNLFLGSEGTLGIIVQAKLRIHKKPLYYSWKIALFKNFNQGTEAVREIVQQGIHPAIMRLSNEQETHMFSLLSHNKKSRIQLLLEGFFKTRLKKKGYSQPCILMMRFAIRNKSDITAAEIAIKIALSKGAKPLPSSLASNWENSRFSLPYLRDTLVEHRVLIDTFETVTYWKNLLPLYNKVKSSLETKCDYFQKGGILLCHISHVYETGASLYFTMMVPQVWGREYEQWQKLKQVVSDTIVESGGAISHHHGIGKDHQMWFLKQMNPGAGKIFALIKHHFDPDNILNPGKLWNA